MDKLLATQPRPKAWPTPSQCRNSDTGKTYRPHHEDERAFVLDDGPRYVLAKGGEGGGKSVAGIVKSLYKLGRGLSPGVMGSPDFEHFKKSLWPEFRRWCPWDYVVPSQRRRANKEWAPNGPFDMVFQTPNHGDVVLTCGGFEDPGGWEGPNLNFAHFDEARRHKTAAMLKVLDGRVRIAGPNGEPPQLFITTTPRKHWLFDYFGPAKDDDPRAAFKANARTIDLYTADNAPNLAAGYVQNRRNSLTESEARVLLEAAWEDIAETDRFLPSMTWWDALRESLPPMTRRDALVIGLDGSVNNDSTALVAVSRHPTRHDDVAVRHLNVWEPRGGQINFADVEATLDNIVGSWNVIEVAFDPYQLQYLAQRIRAKGRVMVTEFSQGGLRLEADKHLLDLITQRRLAHDGNAQLRAHVDNADKKVDGETRKLRLMKREPSLKIDAAVALSMAAYRCLQLPL